MKKHKPKKIDLSKLKNIDINTGNNSKVQYSNNLGDKIKLYKNEIYNTNTNSIDNNVSNRWKNIRDILINTAEEFLGNEKIAPRKHWLTVEITDLMLKRRSVRNKNDTHSINECRRITNQ